MVKLCLSGPPGGSRDRDASCGASGVAVYGCGVVTESSGVGT